MNKILRSLLFILLFPGFLLASETKFEIGVPVFVGRSANNQHLIKTLRLKSIFDVKRFMLAVEMKAYIAYLTGYEHPGFDRYAGLIGKIDPANGSRSTDSSSSLILFLLTSINFEIADAVIQRELFLGDDQRIVFSGVELAISPDDGTLPAFLQKLYQEWFIVSASDSLISELVLAFRRFESEQSTLIAYKNILHTFLLHGALYYY